MDGFGRNIIKDFSTKCLTVPKISLKLNSNKDGWTTLGELDERREGDYRVAAVALPARLGRELCSRCPGSLVVDNATETEFTSKSVT